MSESACGGEAAVETSRGRIRWMALAALVTGAVAGLLWLSSSRAASGNREAAVLHVAVAANFTGVHAELASRFTERTGAEVRVSIGSTGQLYAQIRNGAPFDLFLAADSARPRRLETEGRVASDGRVSYALGRLALYAPRRIGALEGGGVLRTDGWRHLAVANPRTAPYGAAALEALEAMGLAAALAGRLVRGENIGQAYQYVRSGAAELGFVSLSQVVGEDPDTYWLVPEGLHRPIVQQAVLLEGARRPDLARRYLEFLLGLEARRALAVAGYGVPEAGWQ